MTRLFVKRYLLIIVYTIVFFLCCLGILFINNDIVIQDFISPYIIVLSNSLLIRVFDDYFDYESDAQNNKMIFSKPTLLILGIICLSTSIMLSWSHYLFFNILVLLLIVLPNMKYKKNLLKYFKLIILPALIAYSLFSNKLEKNIYCYLFILLSIIISLLFYRKQVRKK